MAGMKPRYAAALALVGWYLMTTNPRSSLPLSLWTITKSFDTAAQCEAVRLADEQQAARDFLRKQNVSVGQINFDSVVGWNLANELCIASDDSRLKEK
jgi:hypothetical protein